MPTAWMMSPRGPPATWPACRKQGEPKQDMYKYVVLKWKRKKWGSFSIMKRDGMGDCLLWGGTKVMLTLCPSPSPAVEKAAHRVMCSGELFCPSLGKEDLAPHMVSSVMLAQVKREGGREEEMA